MAIARDKFWMFGVRPHQDDHVMLWGGEGQKWLRSRITPAEGAAMLDVPNMLMINCQGIPVPFSEDAYGYAESFCRMQNVLWSATGAGGFRVGNEEAFICKLAEEYPNIRGAFLDDFYYKFKGKENWIAEAEALLREIRTGLDQAVRPLEIAIVWYTRDMSETLDPCLLRYIDTISLWTWKCEELLQLEERFTAIEKNFPTQKKMLGIYMYDFDTNSPVPTELMEHQCEFGLRMLREGRLDAMIFEANSVMGLGLTSELWLRKWIDKVKNTPVP